MSDYYTEDESFDGSIDLAIWRRLVRHAFPYRKAIFGLCAAGLGVATADIGIPIVTGRLIDEAAKRGITSVFYGYGALYIGLFLFLSACIYVFIDMAGRVATGVARDLREAGFARLQSLSFSFFDVRPTGWLVTRLTSDCSKISSLMPWFLLDIVWGGALIIGSIVAMLWLHWGLALAVLIIVPPLVAISLFFQSRLLESSRMIRKTNSQITASFNEAVMGVRTTKVLAREEAALGEFQGLSGGMFDHSMRNALQSAVYLPLITSMGSVGVGLALWSGGHGVLQGTGLTLGTLIVFMQFAALLHMPIQELARRFTDLQSAQAAAERVQGLLDTEPEIQDSPEVAQALAQRTDATEALAPDGHDAIIEELAFRGVKFAYKPDEPVIHGFDLEVKRGQTIALVGATGSGKSTLVNLLARFYEPTAGEILLNGVEYRQRGLDWLQSQLGVVLQTPHLFTGSIKENIRYGRLDATDEEIEAAATQVGAHGIISALSDGYDSEVGEGGSRLSIGQRQLIALARAILADPQIFIMDEATSSVDTETEQLIQRGIETMLAGRFSFIIAHRLSTIRNADRILVLDKGRVIEDGDHRGLMRAKGHYHKLYTRQFTQHAGEHFQGELSPAEQPS